VAAAPSVKKVRPIKLEASTARARGHLYFHFEFIFDEVRRFHVSRTRIRLRYRLTQGFLYDQGGVRARRAGGGELRASPHEALDDSTRLCG